MSDTCAVAICSALSMVEGDIVITRVARHYSLGRVNDDHQTQTPIESHDHRAEAISRACTVAGADQQVFIYEEADSSSGVQVDLNPAPGTRWREMVTLQSPPRKNGRTQLGTVAMFSASDQTVAMMQDLLIEAGNNQSLIQCPFADLKRGITNFEKYLDLHNPEVVIFDISPPYDANWAFFTTIRDHAVMQGRGVVLTTTSKDHLDELNGEESDAFEVVGTLADHALILAAIKAATRLARTDKPPRD